MKRVLLVAFGLSGFAALVYEVAWTRSLSLILGSTTYALSTMLSTFMAGLAIGSFIGGKLADHRRNLLLMFGLMELGIGVFGLVTIPLIHALPPFYFWVYSKFHHYPNVYFAFQFITCAMVMIVPTTLMGATFPVVSKRVTSSFEVMGQGVGGAYSFNTMGAILGSFSAGFILIPLMGVKLTAITAACVNISVAVTIILLSKARKKGLVAAVAILAISLPAATALSSAEEKWPVNFYLVPRVQSLTGYQMDMKGTEILFNKDFREGRVKAWKAGDYLFIETGGKIEGTGPSDMQNAILLAYLPIAAHKGPESFLTIGLGSGVTLGAAKESVPENTLVEINRGVVEAVDRFGKEGLLDDVETVIQDARIYLKYTDRKFDIISSEPSYPADPGTGNLFTKEFYEEAARSLKPDGIFCQWLPYYMLKDEDVTMMVRTFGSVFENVELWKMAHFEELLILGSNSPFAYSTDEIQERVHNLNKTEVKINLMLSRTPEQVKEIVSERTDVPLNTDDHPRFEFSVARNLLEGSY